jgi:tetratricopeptide (TPR) repeat protein
MFANPDLRRAARFQPRGGARMGGASHQKRAGPIMTQTIPSAASEAEALAEQAAAHHRAGAAEAAEPLYRAALERDPRCWRALHNLGLIHLDRKQPDQALPLLSAALAVEPAGAETWLALARGLINAGRFGEAEALLAGHADHPRARAVEIRLRQAWGMAQVQARAFDEAQAQFRSVLALAPEDAHAHGDLGYALLAGGDPAAAEPHLRRAAELAPDHTGVLQNLGSALYKLGRVEEAAEAYWRAVRLDPRDSIAPRNLGTLLTDIGDGEAALALAALTEPQHPRLARLIRADALTNLGRYREAAALLDELAAATPDDAPALYRRAFVRLLVGDFEGGWRDYEHRWRIDAFVQDSAPIASRPLAPFLDVSTGVEGLAGRRILLVGEQGVGDQIMFASMIPDLARAAGPVTFLAEPRLAGLFSAAFPQVEVRPMTDARVAPSDFDKVLALGGLGRLFRNGPQDFPRTPYLRAGEAARRRWAERLGPKPAGGLRIGISWRGGTKKTRGPQRSVSLAQLAPVLDLPGCQFVSLQYGDVEAQLAAFNAGRGNPVRAFPKGEIDDFEDLAGLLEGLDAVVSVQTAVVHLCGAIGKPCLALISYRAEWRYTAEADEMPWYPSVKLLRQTEPGRWDNVVTRAADDLRARIG